MAEAFGVVAGALSAAALFNNCVESFEYIQLGRRFGHDFERSRLKLDIAQTRLSRWGQAVAIHGDPGSAQASPSESALTDQVESILEQIQLLFQALQKKSARYKLASTPEDASIYTTEEMQPVSRRLHEHLSQVVRQRQQQTSLVRKTTWALYDAKDFNRLLGQITGFIDDLEDLYPASKGKACRALARAEMEGVDEEPAKLAHEVGADVDGVLSQAAEARATELVGSNSAGKIGTRGAARVKIGSEVVGTYSGSLGILDRTVNRAGDIHSQGTSRVHIGTSFGGRGFFDD